MTLAICLNSLYKYNMSQLNYTLLLYLHSQLSQFKLSDSLYIICFLKHRRNRYLQH